MKAADIPKSVFHITHRKNLKNIARYGIFSHSWAKNMGVVKGDISDPEVQKLRENKSVHEGFKLMLHDCVPCFFNPRNAMLNAAIRDSDGDIDPRIQNKLVMLEIPIDTQKSKMYFFSAGNAAREDSTIYPDAKDLGVLCWDLIWKRSWRAEREPEMVEKVRSWMMSEFLVIGIIGKEEIKYLHYNNSKKEEFYRKFGFEIKLSPELFF